MALFMARAYAIAPQNPDSHRTNPPPKVILDHDLHKLATRLVMKMLKNLLTLSTTMVTRIKIQASLKGCSKANNPMPRNKNTIV